MNKTTVKEPLFKKGQIVQFCNPNPALYKHFGLRVYTTDLKTVVTPPEDKALGLVLAYLNTMPHDTTLDHTSGEKKRYTYQVFTPFYKVLLNEQVLWISEKHLILSKMDLLSSSTRLDELIDIK